MALGRECRRSASCGPKWGRAELERLELLPCGQRRKQLLQSLDGLETEIEQLNRRVEAEVAQRYRRRWKLCRRIREWDR